ncbi:hypothetical protein MHC_00960 [Mycoplasma haemocanis str. Illinois]|uniref:Uncharacterized protein n=1 Tax=Mycoplasma haemocanis (strain Illinois) TaxID=1111676 RepID=H6N5U8_MYCHN|nr:hypothetical protein [Mycoplasma haemocanis]AEW45058.2 hypothetical protein MHC_00960 [Mycoplasma haemocanis str. Illinois]
MSSKSFLYRKNYLFFKRTSVLLTPLFLFTLASKELAFNSSQLNLLSISDFLDSKEEESSIKSLYTLLSDKNNSSNVKDYGSLIIKKLDDNKEYWIEQNSPFSSVSHSHDYKFKEIPLTSLSSQEQGESGKYTLTSDNYENTLQLKEVGNPNLLTVLDLSIYSGSPIKITHVFPFSDLVSSSTKTYPLVNLKDSSNSESHQLKLTKDVSKKSVSIEIIKGHSGGSALASLAIKSFYVLFNDDPPQDPKKYFSEISSEQISTDTYGSPFKKVFLDRWSSSSEPKYEFTTSSNFWSSICQDPYKVGGFIDKQSASTASSSSTGASSQESQYIKKQLNSFYEFREQVGLKPQPSSQYYYEQIKEGGLYIPSSDYDEKTPCEKLDSETKKKLGEYAGDSVTGKSWDREEVKNVDKSLIPKPLKDEINSPSPSPGNYPKYKLVQSSFRAWGNAYSRSDLKGSDIKKKGIYSSSFEEAVQSSHDFTITIKKDKLKSKLIEHDSLKKQKDSKSLQERPEISSMMEVYYPLSFSFYDPISNYFKKRSLYLKTELDLSYLFYQDSFEKEVFAYDISSENGEIGYDYGGLEVFNTSRKTSYGLSGKLQFIAGLSLSKEKDLKINLKTKVSGFVNTKNPCVDLRHRLYKISSSSSDQDPKFECSNSNTGWKYRDYIHIPSFLTISLDREPEVSSFYLDKSFESTSQETLKKFNDNLDSRKIKKVIKTDFSNDGQIYFKELGAAYSTTKSHSSDSTHQITTSSFWSRSQNQYIYYYAPRKQTNSLDLDVDGLGEITIHISGAKTTLNRFFHTSHFNTKRTVCTNDSDSGGSKECGNGNKYKEILEDKAPAELLDKENLQTLKINWSSIKSSDSDSDATEIKFRFVLNRDGDAKDAEFQENNQKYKKLFGDSANNPSTSTEIPNHSCLAVWYSIKLWKTGNKLHYVTMLRPISLVSEPIKNSTAHKISGSAGSAGFEINKFELSYYVSKKK